MLAELLGCNECSVDVKRFSQPCVNGSVENPDLQLSGINGHDPSFPIIHSVRINMFSHIAHLRHPWERFVKFIECSSYFNGEFWDTHCYLG